MTLVQWNEGLETHIPVIDSDHKILVNLLNQVNACVQAREERFIVSSVLNALVDYTRYHFGREERLQERCGYPGLEQHRKSHLELTGQVDDLRQRFAGDPDQVRANEVEEFLKHWLTDHILDEDFRYREVCADNPEAIAAAEEIMFYETARHGEKRSKAPAWNELGVLVVDDNPNFLKLLRTVLRVAGIRNLQTVESAGEGLERVTRKPPHVVLCDWVMDEMDGGEFARRVRELEIPTKVILVTGFTSEDIRRRAGGLGADGFLEKPFTPFELFQAINEVFADS